ncbi:MAG: hypothetical protein D6752_04015 [Candidatus Nitrosothermus koennekii]|nr:MAG: hypothetical protein D6752_04015 [Candidatus Nitrosothermus koennekii]
MNAFLFKRGCTESINGDSVILRNEDGETFKVNKIVYLIWDICEGIHFNDLLISLAFGSRDDAIRLTQSLEDLLKDLSNSKLLYIKQIDNY